jgi:hypothetical protein
MNLATDPARTPSCGGKPSLLDHVVWYMTEERALRANFAYSRTTLNMWPPPFIDSESLA